VARVTRDTHFDLMLVLAPRFSMNSHIESVLFHTSNFSANLWQKKLMLPKVLINLESVHSIAVRGGVYSITFLPSSSVIQVSPRFFIDSVQLFSVN
jgi:hypothetical protein